MFLASSTDSNSAIEKQKQFQLLVSALSLPVDSSSSLLLSQQLLANNNVDLDDPNVILACHGNDPGSILNYPPKKRLN